jgi:hypothetical protein
VNGTRRTPDRALGYATRLQTVLRGKAKARGDFGRGLGRKKTAMLGTANYVAGIIQGEKKMWTDCDRNLRAALLFREQGPAIVSGGLFLFGPREL